MANKIVIYTVITNNYDRLLEPPIIEGCDYVCFIDEITKKCLESSTATATATVAVTAVVVTAVAATATATTATATTADSNKPTVWKYRLINFKNKDPHRISRHPKINPHLYFPEYTISIYLDANQTLKGLPGHFQSFNDSDSVIALFNHIKRDCLYEEGKVCIKLLLDNKRLIRNQLSKYRAAQHPSNSGLWQAGFIIRKHNNPLCIKLMKEWWSEFCKHSRRDQISLPFVLKNNNVIPFDLSENLKYDIFNHPLISIRKHSKSRQLK